GPDPLKSANQIHAAVGPQIAEILNKAMAQKPEERYASANEFREALRRMGRTRDEAAKAEHRTPRTTTFAGETIHISDLPQKNTAQHHEVNIALVGSAKRFGPAGATVVLALLVALAAGVMFASQRWNLSADEVTTATSATDTADALRARKTERTRSAENAGLVNAKPANSTEKENAAQANVAPVVSAQTEKKSIAEVKPAN